MKEDPQNFFLKLHRDTFWEPLVEPYFDLSEYLKNKSHTQMIF